MFNIDRTKFSLKRKALASSYSSLNLIKNKFSSNRVTGNSVLNIASFTEGSQIDRFFKAPGNNQKDCSQLSNTLYDTNRVYNLLLNYLSNMFYWRYTVTPRRIKFAAKPSKEEYLKMMAINNHVRAVKIPTIGVIDNISPSVDATPFPPLNFNQIG